MTGGGEVGRGGGRVLGSSIEDCTMLNARLDCSSQGFLLQFGPSVLFPQGFVQYSSFVEGMLVGKGRNSFVWIKGCGQASTGHSSACG